MEVVSSRVDAAAYRVEVLNDQVVETRIEARFLGSSVETEQSAPNKAVEATADPSRVEK